MYTFDHFSALRGKRLNLETCREGDLTLLARTLVSPTTWFTQTRDVTNEKKFVQACADLRLRMARGEAWMLTARLQTSGEIVGMSAYQHPGKDFYKIEIGYTWIADVWKKTFVNTELKLLMIDYAFGVMGVQRLEFAVHPKNQASNAAMRRLGAFHEGCLRRWRPIAGSAIDNGDRNIYSFLAEEWPPARERLLR